MPRQSLFTRIKWGWLTFSPRRRWWLGLALSWMLAMAALWRICPSPLLSGELMVVPEMLTYKAWWQRPIVVGSLLLVLASIAYILVGRITKRILVAVVVVVAVLGGCGWGYFHLVRQNEQEQQSCANCRSFVAQFLNNYAEEHDGWFPRGGTNEWDSLSKAVKKEMDVHHFTSHALGGKAYQYWKRTGSLSDAVCCYRYIEGLHIEDPPGLLIMYYEKPSYWECSHHRTKTLGRICMIYGGAGWASWDYLDESEFTNVLKKTQQYLQIRHERRKQDIDRLRETLLLSVDHQFTPPHRYRFRFSLTNHGNQTLHLWILNSHVRGRSGSSSALWSGTNQEIRVDPGSVHLFDWWLEYEVEYNLLNGRVVGKSIRHRTSDSSSGGRSYGAGGAQTLEEANAAEWISAWALLRVVAHGMEPLELPIWSEPFYYLKKSPPLQPASADARIDELIEALQSHQHDEYFSVIELGDFGVAAQRAVPALIEAFASAKKHEKASYVETFGKMGPGATAAVPLLINALEENLETNDDFFDGMRIAEALGKIGPGATNAIPVLKLARRSRRTLISDAAKTALENIQKDTSELTTGRATVESP